MKTKVIRLARETDAAEILEIYKPYIEDTAITFECEVPSFAEFGNRIKEISFAYPYLVCTSNQKIIGYAYAHRQMEREAYQWNAELSVYLEKTYFHCGVGKTLYQALIDILKMQNVRNVYGGVTSPNDNSERLHESLGFKKLGVYHNTGYKHGAWHDVAWFEKAIDDRILEPQPFLSIQEIDQETVENILDQYAEKLNAIGNISKGKDGGL